MVKHILTRLLNHLVNQNAWAREQLVPHGGKSVCFHIPPVRAVVTVLEDGGLAMAGSAAVPDATVTVPAPIALRLLANDESATTLATLEGDTELAASLARVLRGMHWDYEEDLSTLIGDAPAHEISKFGRKTVSEVKKQSRNVAEMLVEYWQEEQPLIAKKRHVMRYLEEVDALRDDTDRLEKRLEKLAEKLAQRSTSSPES